MPKLLFLAHPFPPCPVVGAVRTWNMARYLAKSGWDITVVTADPSVWRRNDDPLRGPNENERARIRRILTRHSWACLDPDLMNCRNTGIAWVLGGACRRIAGVLNVDSGVGWVRPAERACSSVKPD